MPEVKKPEIGEGCQIEGILIGAVEVGNNTIINEKAVIRGDEGFTLHIGAETKVGLDVVLHGLETEESGKKVEKNIVKINNREYSVYIGEHCTLDDGVQVHGPAAVEDDVTLYHDAFVFKAKIGKHCVVGENAKVIGVKIPDNMYIPAGIVINDQEQIKQLMEVSKIQIPSISPRKNYLKGKNLNAPLNISKGHNSYTDKEAIITGEVVLGDEVYVAPYSYIISDKDKVVVGTRSNVQDGVILTSGEKIEGVTIGQKVSLAHQAKVFGGIIEDGSFIGMQSELYDVTVGKGCVIEPGCKLENVKIPDRRYVPAGSIITEQSQANDLPEITPEYIFSTLNEGVVHVNEQLAEQYSKMVS